MVFFRGTDGNLSTFFSDNLQNCPSQKHKHDGSDCIVARLSFQRLTVYRASGRQKEMGFTRGQF